MSDFKKKTLISDFRAIKLGIVALLLTGLGLLVAGEVQAITFTERFDSYDVGELSGQGDWVTPYGSHSCWVDSIRAYSLPYSISVKDNWASCGGQNDWATTSEGYFTLNFLGETKETGLNYFIFFNTSVLQLSDTQVVVGNPQVILPQSDWSINVWHTIGIEFNTAEGWIRGRFDFNNWSATTTFVGPLSMLTFVYQNGYRNEQDFFIDNLRLVGSYSEYVFEQLGLPELPELEDCSVLGVTDRILCEIKNFFYRLFVPSPDKISDLKDTMETIKTKFPYSYIKEFQEFFTYLKDNVDDEQPITFSILGQQASLDFAFWHTTTTIAGSEQTIKDIVQKVFGFLILLGFGFWCFGFIKRIFK